MQTFASRRSTISTQKERVTIGLGNLLAMPENVTPMPRISTANRLRRSVK